MAKIVSKTLKWNASASTDTTGYKVYWATTGVADYTSTFANVGNVTSVKIPTDISTFPTAGGAISVGITAYDAAGNESDMTLISATLDFTAPLAVTGLAIS
jgi:hypothetical protein